MGQMGTYITHIWFYNHFKHLGRTRLGVLIRPVWIWRHFHQVYILATGFEPTTKAFAILALPGRGIAINWAECAKASCRVENFWKSLLQVLEAVQKNLSCLTSVLQKIVILDRLQNGLQQQKFAWKNYQLLNILYILQLL